MAMPCGRPTISVNAPAGAPTRGPITPVVDDPETFEIFSERGVDGFFTNRPDLLLEHYGKEPQSTVDEILARHGYEP